MVGDLDGSVVVVCSENSLTLEEILQRDRTLSVYDERERGVFTRSEPDDGANSKCL